MFCLALVIDGAKVRINSDFTKFFNYYFCKYVLNNLMFYFLGRNM
ncbi:hypothetical protein SAMN05216463_11453 [Xylanibacter ruminicola]|uniref:Uncharacterized protein n=1 Tax=Xylanibacter ruminicola TaxID=839 RepID=A0A1M6VWQ5_XYLRU|nr:hypothetical protein SAMN05216463_11453 [Xylanibacter ruminicola]